LKLLDNILGLETAEMATKTDLATKEDIKSLPELIKNVLERLTDIEKNLGERVDSLEARAIVLEESNVALTKKVTLLEDEVAYLQQENRCFKIDTERRSKEYNLLFHGLESTGPTESAAQSEVLVKKFLSEELAMDRQVVDKIAIAHAHRLPQHTKPAGLSESNSGDSSKSAPIVVKFIKMSDKQNILLRAPDARKHNVGITPHLPVSMQKQRRRLLPIAKGLFNKGNKIKWKIIGPDYCLFVNGSRHIEKQYN